MFAASAQGVTHVIMTSVVQNNDVNVFTSGGQFTGSVSQTGNQNVINLGGTTTSSSSAGNYYSLAPTSAARTTDSFAETSWIAGTSSVRPAAGDRIQNLIASIQARRTAAPAPTVASPPSVLVNYPPQSVNAVRQWLLQMIIGLLLQRFRGQ